MGLRKQEPLSQSAIRVRIEEPFQDDCILPFWVGTIELGGEKAGKVRLSFDFREFFLHMLASSRI